METPVEKRLHNIEQFEKIRAQLNENQLSAVQTIEGPVLAIAGPGTGKTHILTARIGEILLQTDTQPANILCLTFTEAGVTAMRQRLLEFIGPEAHRVHIFTFHSFCNRIIQENVELFGRSDLKPLSDLERIEVVRAILDNLDSLHLLKSQRSDAYHYEAHLSELFKRMKTEGWDTETVINQIDAYLEDLPNQEEFIYQRNSGTSKKGDIKRAKIEEVTYKMERLKSAVILFKEYIAQLKFRHRYDYEDMILWVLDAFKEHEYLLRRYQEQYLYVLVDEFQDTNGAQNHLINKLMEYWEDNPNIFIVGDDDQSIYEFQGARLRNMMEFFYRYQTNLKLILLTNNYRSSQHILNISKALIDKNELRLIKQLIEINVDKNLVASNELVAQSPLRIQLVEYPNRLQEEIDIVQQIQQLTKKGVSLNDIAIIFARHRQAKNIVRLLEKNDIPYKTKRRLNILEIPLIRNIRQFLVYLSKEMQQPYSGDEILFELLHYGFTDIAAPDIAKLSAYLAQDTHKKYKSEDYANFLYWADILHDTHLLNSLGLKNIAAIERFVAFIDDLQQDIYQFSLPELVELIYNKSGLLRWVLQHPQKAWFVQVIHTFFGFVQQEADRNPNLNLQELLYIWSKMESNKIELGLYKTSYSEEGVNLITAHSAKGLEFKYVFMINCLKEYWENNNSNRGQRFVYPDTLNCANETDELEAARRLFYVAMTRAKEGLQLSYYGYNEEEKVQERSRFIDEILDTRELQVQYKNIAEDTLFQEQERLLLQHETTSIELVEKELLRELLEDFKLSVSAMNTYLYCPLSFYYEFVLRVPHTPSAEALYGIAVHDALKRLFDVANRDIEKLLPSETQFLEYFKEALLKQRSQMRLNMYQHFLELGIHTLPNYYQQRQLNWQQQIKHREVLTEKGYRNLEMNGIPLTGVIDKLIFCFENGQNYWHVLDYKTGKLKEDRLRPITGTNLVGGNYWRQLIFYKILVEHSKSTPYLVTKGEIDYLSPNLKGEFESKTIEINYNDVVLVKNQIKEVYQNIQQHNFSNGCGKPTCKWCNFVKRSQAIDSFSNEEIEELDDRY